MKKTTILTLAAMALYSMKGMAGGLLTNTNQNASFLRMMSQDGIIDITGLYANPAGTAFLNNGWHVSLNVQSAYQSRNIETTFPLFALNTSNPGQTTHKFEGRAKAPAIPSFQLSYNKDKWSVNANFAISGGGGKCEFKEGLGSFEALYSGTIAQQLPGTVNATISAMMPSMLSQGLQQAGLPEAQATAAASKLAPTATVKSQMTGYSLNSYMSGRQYYFGLQVGATYKVMDNLGVYVGVRGVYGSCSYDGYVQDITANYAYSYNVPENAALGFPGTEGQGTGSVDLRDQSLALNCSQTGFGITPVIGIDWKINKQWNVAAKYEFNTCMKLKNSTETNDYTKQQMDNGNATLAQFADGTKVHGDIPGILTLGAQYAPMESLRLNGGFHYYFDKSAKAYGDKQKLIDKNTWELTAGVEYDICKLFTVSASWQKTQYGMSDAYMNDLSFNVPSNAIGLGFRLHATKRCNVDLGYMHCFYKDRTVTTATAAGDKIDRYSRTNDVFGIGVNLSL